MSADLYLRTIEKKHVTDGLLTYLNAEWHSFYDFDELIKVLPHTNSFWVASNSTLKRMLFGEDEKYVPSICDTIWDILGEWQPVTLTREISDKIIAAFDLPDESIYGPKSGWRSGDHYSKNKDSVKEFLESNMGKEIFALNE